MNRIIKNITFLFLLLLTVGAVRAQVDDKGVTSTGKEVDCSTINPSVDQAVDQYGAIVTRPTLTRNGKLITRDCYCPFDLGDGNASITDFVYCTSVKMFAELSYRDPEARELPKNARVYVFTDAAYTHCVDTVEPAVIEHLEGKDTLTVDITGLSCYTRYYFRLVATNTTECVFDWTDSTRDVTLGNPTACDVLLKFANEHSSAAGTIDSVYDHEGNAYTVVQIGDQCWLRENMRCTTSPRQGIIMLQDKTSEKSVSFENPYYYVPANPDKNGLLYNFSAVIDTNKQVVSISEAQRRGICPKGWHVPTDGEWFNLEQAVLNMTPAISSNPGYRGSGVGKLVGGCDWSETGNASNPGNYMYADRNSSGFNVLPVGCFNNELSFNGESAYFWSSSVNDAQLAWDRSIIYSNEGVYRHYDYRNGGFSVRCLRDFLIPSVTLCGDCEDSTIVIKAMTNTDSLVLLNSAKAQIKTMSQPVVDTAFTSLQPGKYYVMSISYTGGTALDSITLTLQNTSCNVLAKFANEHSSAAGTIDSVYDHEGNAYTVVQIGNQCWLRENMRATTEPGDPTNILQFPAQSNSNHAPKYAYYPNDNPDNYAKWGCLYNWPAAMNGSTTEGSRGICPEGWHVPTDGEWTTMLSSADVGQNSGKNAGKLAGGCDWEGDDPAPTGPCDYLYSDRDSTGFSALPVGVYNGGVFINVGTNTDFWSSTPFESLNAYAVYLYSPNEYVYRSTYDRIFGFSVRCVRDYECDFIPETSCNVLQKLSNEHQSATGVIDTVYDHEGNDYSVVQIGDQCWLKENMRATTNVNGTSILQKPASGNSYTAQRAYFYSNDSAYYVKYGCLYNWPAVMNINDQRTNFTYPQRGICPQGWHVPTMDEWNQMLTEAGTGINTTDVGVGKLIGGCDWVSTSIGSQPGNYAYPDRNNSGLSVLPAGWYVHNPAGGYNNSFKHVSDAVYYWSANSKDQQQAYRYLFNNSFQYCEQSFGQRDRGFAVRCLRNTPTPATISFNANGGSGTMTAMNVTTMKDTVLKANTLIRENATFKCWSTDRSGCGTLYEDESHITTTSDMTLYAQWNTNCTVTSVRSNEIGSGQVDSLKDVDGNKYAVVQIGNQCWMKENLKTTRYADSTNIQLGNVPSSDIAYRYNPNGEASNVAVYGYLYNWPAIMNRALSSTAIPSGVQGVCPDGWHVPSNAEWNLMLQAVAPPASNFDVSSTGVKGASTDIAALLSGGCSWKSDSKAKTAGNAFDNSRNASCFTALPAAYYTGNETDLYPHFEEWAIFGTSTGTYKDYVIEYNSTGIRYNNNTPAVATSVRCVRDYECDVVPETSCKVLQKLSNEHQSAAGIIDSVYDHEGNDYSVVQIGNQCWMKQNLRTTTTPDGTLIKLENKKSTSVAYRFIPARDETSVPRLGYLYNWKAIMNGAAATSNNPSGVRGICPEGWHLPSDNEWKEMGDSLHISITINPSSDASLNTGASRLVTGCEWLSVNSGDYPGNFASADRNNTGFSALATGYFNRDSLRVVNLGKSTVFWSTSIAETKVYTVRLSNNVSRVASAYDWSDGGFAVRCVRDVIIPEFSLCEDTTFGTLTLKEVKNAEKIEFIQGATVKKIINNPGTYVYVNDLAQGNYQVKATSTSGDTLVDNAYIKHTYTHCTGTAHAGTNLGGGKWANKEWSSVTDQIDSVSDHEGNVYEVVQIGDQCWLKENMRATTSPKGLLTIAEPTVADPKQPKCYEYSSAISTSSRERGILYNWAGAMDTTFSSLPGSKDFPNHRGICPEGWHLPTDAEWKVLEKEYLRESNGDTITNSNLNSMSSRGKGAGKFTSGCGWSGMTYSGTYPNNYSYSERNISRFSVAPAGAYADATTKFKEDGIAAYFWTSTSYNASYTWYRSLKNDAESVTHMGCYRQWGMSVRCLRNVPIPVTISFNANGGSGTMTAMNVMTMKDTVLDENNFTHGGNFEFAGWNTKRDGSGTAYADRDSITPTESITLYAQWNSYCDANQVMSNERGTGRVDSVKDYQDNWYKVVQINGICVLKENLRVVDTTPSGRTMALQTGFATESMRYAHKDVFGMNGYLYNWCSAMDTTGTVYFVSPFRRGICPLGWHIPETTEWETIFAGNKAGSYAAFNDSYEGTSWATSTIANAPGNINDLYKDTTGFSAIPVGYFGNTTDMTFGNGSSAQFWTATIYNTSAANSFVLNNDAATVTFHEQPTKGYGLSVRCVRDYPTLSISSDKDNISDLKLCGGQDVTYTAEVHQADVNITPTGYKWSVNNVDSTSITNTLSCHYTVTGTYNVRCVAYYGDNDSLVATKATKITTGGTAPTLGLCEDCEAGSIIVKSNNCTSLTWVNNADPTKTATTTGTTGISVSEATPAGVYTVTGVNADGCTVTRTVTLGDYVAHPCTVNSKNDNELGRTDNTIDSVADHEGNWYKVVQIGNQCWLAENMRATTEPTTPTVSLLQKPASTISYVEPRAYYYSNSIDNYNKYGCLYNFLAAMNGSTSEGARGICPEGWHIPRDGEWFALEKEVLGLQPQDSSRSESVKGSEVGRLIGGCDWQSSNSSNYAGNYSYPERNSYGFSAFPAGYYGGSFKYVTQNAFFWSSTQTEATKAQRRVFAYNSNGINRSGGNLADGFSVRCLRDYPIPVTISFNANGGSGTMDAMNVTTMKDTVLDARGTNITHEGNWAFTGWNTKMDGTGTAYDDHAQITPTESMTLYAQWHTWCDANALLDNELGSENGRVDSVKDHQDNWYKVVQIGGQCWLKENMRATTAPENVVTFTHGGYTSNYATPRYYTPAGTQTFTIGGAVVDSARYVERYGIMYNFSAAMTINSLALSFSYPVRGICPQGWHLPQFSESESLMSTMGITGSIGTNGVGAGKLVYGCEWHEDNTAETSPGNFGYIDRNSSGFSALPAGAVNNGSYDNVGDGAYFWTSTPTDVATQAKHFRCFYKSPGMHMGLTTRGYAFSVRCVRN